MPQYKIMQIKVYGAVLDIPDFLEPFWPYDLELIDFPTFCGAGQGLGDKLIKDIRCEVNTAPACLVHDVEWTLCDKSYFDAIMSNVRLYKNTRSLLLANYNKDKYSQKEVEWESFKVFVGVTWGIFFHFKPTPEKCGNNRPWGHRHFRKLITRLKNVKR